jgi:uncharacterized protein (TIGR00730 family)
MKSILLYCGSSKGTNPIYESEARLFGEALALRNIKLVFGAGSVGLMGVVANAVLAGGGTALGVITEQLMAWEVDHKGIQELVVTPDMHTRKQRMFAEADAIVALPGGFGTMDELFEQLTWSQLGLHAKPIALLNTEGFFDTMLQFLNHMVLEGFLKKENLELLVVAKTVPELFEKLDNYSADAEPKWII